jgi:uncharacterized protein
VTHLIKSLTLSVASLALSCAAHAQTAAPAPVVPEDADPALWVVKDADTTIYLFGTVHMLKPGLSWFDEAVKDAFDKSDQLKIEVILPEDQAEMVSRTIPLALDQSGTKLSSLLSDTQRTAYESAMGKLGLPAAQFDVFEPWFAGLTLGAVSLVAQGYDPEQGSEKTLVRAAKASGKPVAGLETLEEQMGFFDTLPRDAQLQFLNDTVAQLPTAAGEFANILLAWKQGDPDELGVRMNRSLSGAEVIAETLLYKRNERWADWIKTRMDQPGTVFMAVGAGHLAGAKSVQDYLSARGLTAERIRY